MTLAYLRRVPSAQVQEVRETFARRRDKLRERRTYPQKASALGGASAAPSWDCCRRGDGCNHAVYVTCACRCLVCAVCVWRAQDTTYEVFGRGAHLAIQDILTVKVR